MPGGVAYTLGRVLGSIVKSCFIGSDQTESLSQPNSYKKSGHAFKVRVGNYMQFLIQNIFCHAKCDKPSPVPSKNKQTL